MQTSIRRSCVRNICTVALLAQASLAATWGATIYYVSPTGNDSNVGTEAAPFRTIQRGADAVSPGDTVIVKDGVYTENPDPRTWYPPDPPDPNWAGWASQVLIVLEKGGDDGGGGGAEPRWVTFKSENKGGAVLDGQNGQPNAKIYGFLPRVAVSYIRIQDFEIRGFDKIGIGMSGSGSNYEFSGNHIHDIGGICSDSDDGFVGIYLGSVSSVVVQKNVIHHIGRFGPDENGCHPQTEHYKNLDHGLYLDSVTNVIVKNNLFYDLTHGWPIHIYSSPRTPPQPQPQRSLNIRIVNNTFAFPNPYPTKDGQILLGHPGVVNATIRNNIFYSPRTAGVAIEQDEPTEFSGVLITYNTVYPGATLSPMPPPSGVEIGTEVNVDPLLLNPGTPANHDFHLQSGSPAKDAGFADAEVTDDFDGLTRPQGSAHDIGAYEGFGGLMAHWKLNEASGVRVDAHSVNHLSDNNGVGQADGRLSNAASFIGANEQTLSIADNAALSMGNIGFTIAGWVRFDRLGLHGVLSKWDSVSLQSEYELEFFVDDVYGSTARFMVSPDGKAVGFVDNYTLLSANTWVFFVAWYDATASTLNLSVDNGPAASVSYSGGAHDGPTPFYLGRTETDYLDGRLDSVSIWKRVLTSAERSSLYSGGGGLDYPF